MTSGKKEGNGTKRGRADRGFGVACYFLFVPDDKHRQGIGGFRIQPLPAGAS